MVGAGGKGWSSIPLASGLIPWLLHGWRLQDKKLIFIGIADEMRRSQWKWMVMRCRYGIRNYRYESCVELMCYVGICRWTWRGIGWGSLRLWSPTPFRDYDGRPPHSLAPKIIFCDSMEERVDVGVVNSIRVGASMDIKFCMNILFFVWTTIILISLHSKYVSWLYDYHSNCLTVQG